MQQTFSCPNCGTQNYIGEPSCRSCGQGFQYNCPYCSAIVDGTLLNCPNCHQPLNWPSQQQAQPQHIKQKVKRTSQGDYQQEKRKSPWLIGCLGVIGVAVLVGVIIAAISGSEAPPSTLPEDTSPPSTSAPAFRVSCSTLFDLLATPADIEPTLVDSEQYAVSGWQRSDLSDGTPRWMAQAGEIYGYELIGKPAYKLTLLAGMTGQVEDSANLMVRAILLIRATGVPKEEAGDVLLELMDKSLADPDKSYKNIAGDSIITVTFYETLSSMLISVEALK